jgi:hypothetical protein
MINVVSAAPSPVGLDSTIAYMTWQHHRQHDSTATSCNNLIVNINDM